MQEKLNRMVLYVSEHCAYCETASHEVRQLSQEFGVPYTIVSIYQHPVQNLPAVPAVYYQGVLFVGHRFAQRLRAALVSPLDLTHATTSPLTT